MKMSANIPQKRPTMLAILDGWGLSNEKGPGNAVLHADTPSLDRLFSEYPHTSLLSSGLSVGLPEGQMGNSEVGHTNIGAGRIVYQSFTEISKSIEDGSFFENAVLLSAINSANKDNHALHIIGLLGPGGVHSHDEHLLALLKLANLHDLKRVYIHACLDGRDTPPKSALGYMRNLQNQIDEIGTGEVATVSGRYYAMDRDKRWDRIQTAYDTLTLGTGMSSQSPIEAIESAYTRGESDEFVKPTNIYKEGSSPITIQSGDSVIFSNFRPDRARELTRAFVDKDFDGFNRTVVLRDLKFVTMTEYDALMPNVEVAFPPEQLTNTLGAYISSLGLKQLRIAETEKYAHVTFFFNGGEEAPNPGEERVLVASPKIATYDLKPEMSAYEVTDKVLSAIDEDKFDLIILNFANCDMVGHTGIIDAAVKAVETVDRCIGKITSAILDVGGQMLITADHGNAESMLAVDGGVMTAHSSNPVPLILVRDDADSLKLRDGGILADIAPTLLDMMELEIPKQMTGHSLLGKIDK
jgi:2,3-bisphosphoglycerate-independent phosphoglycerate mutase